MSSRRKSRLSTGRSMSSECQHISRSSWTATAAGRVAERSVFPGHQQGAESVQYVVETASRIDLPWLTLYAFSLENNLKRPKTEVNFLMRLLPLLPDQQCAADERQQRHALPTLAARMSYPPRCQEQMQAAARGDGAQYRDGADAGAELRGAVRDNRRVCSAVAGTRRRQGGDAEGITEEDLHRHLYTAHMPDPDLA